MKQEDKNLLLRDLCMRLPYGVMCSCIDNNFTPPSIDRELISINLQDETVIVSNDVWNSDFYIESIKPYLRPMSSVSELISAKEWSSLGGIELIDWYNANHIDYRGLIPKGLAIEAPKDMYDIK